MEQMTEESAPAVEDTAPAATETTEAQATETTTETDSETLLYGKDGEAKADGEDDAQSSESVPESYEFTLPDGFTLEGERLEATTNYAKEQGWSQEQAQSAVDMFTKMQGEQAQQQQQVFETYQADLRKQAEADPEIGGANLQQWAADANKGLGAFPEAGDMAELIVNSGLGNHPTAIKYFASVGKLMGEDSGVAGGKPANTSAKPSRTDTLYPDMTEKQE